jgi:acyl-CoA synthetase (AMP-forming)/AMP-acid ligase II
VDATALGGFTERARAVQAQLWKTVTSRGAAPVDWPVAFSFGRTPTLPPALLGCRAEEADGGLTVHWEAPGLPPELAAVLAGALHGHLLRLAAAGNEAPWSDERRRLIPPQQLARRVHAAGSGLPVSRERLAAWAGVPVDPRQSEEVAVTLHVLDDRLEPRPDGVAGRLYLGGPGIARGRWRVPEESTGGFLHHPDTGERLFRTDKTARVRPDGAVEVVEGGEVSE